MSLIPTIGHIKVPQRARNFFLTLLTDVKSSRLVHYLVKYYRRGRLRYIYFIRGSFERELAQIAVVYFRDNLLKSDECVCERLQNRLNRHRSNEIALTRECGNRKFAGNWNYMGRQCSKKR